MAPNQTESQIGARASSPAATSELTNTEPSRIATLPAIGEGDEAPEGPGRTGNKPLMRNQTGCVSLPDRYTAGNTFPRAKQRELPLLSNPKSEILNHNSEESWFIARDIARALGQGWHKKKVHRAAAAENWRVRRHGNRLEYQPPRAIARIIIGSPDLAPRPSHLAPLPVRFCDLTDTEQRLKVTWRKEACDLFAANRSNLGTENALVIVSRYFKTDAWLDKAKAQLGHEPRFDIGPRTLRRWFDRYEKFGIDGLVEQKKGRNGRKPCVRDLEPDQLLGLAAAAIEHGSARHPDPLRRINVARAYRETIVANPTLTGPARAWAHGANASKSNVPESVAAAVKQIATPLATRYAQIGPKAAKLDGPYTECHYDNLKPGQAFTADDMTANAYVWVEWENEQGFILIRPQILAAMDIATMYWLNVRVVMRPKGQYNKDDVWGLIGDVLDEYGRFDRAVLEGGSWQSDVVRGVKTNFTDHERFGGLESIGTKVTHTRTPKGKIIETAFNQLQYQADAVPGYCGRMEMKDCPEATKRMLADVRSGKLSPAQAGFMHQRDYTAHLRAAMNNLNHERGDGKILRGQTPVDEWLAAKIDFATRAVPDKLKYLYRSAYNVSKITRNGFTVRVGTGRSMLSYTWALPAGQDIRGQLVMGFWNDSNPDADAVLYSIRNGKPHQFLCLAKRVQPIARFGAGDEASAAEARRKALMHQVARTQSASLAPFLRRNTQHATRNTQHAPADHIPSATDEYGAGIAARIKAARAASEARALQQAESARRVRAVELTDADRAAAVGSIGRAATDVQADPSEKSDPSDLTPSEIDTLLSSDATTPDHRLMDHEYEIVSDPQHSPADTQAPEEPF